MAFCNKCSTNRGTLVEVYPKSTGSDGIKLCQYCVVGKTLPVIRLHTSNWEMAEVKRFENGRHLVQYFDQETELVVLNEAPFTHYLSHFRVVKDGSDNFEELGDLDPLGVIDAEEDFALAFSFRKNESYPTEWTSDEGADASSEASSPCNRSDMSYDNKKKHPRVWAPDKNNKSSHSESTLDNNFGRSFDCFANAVADASSDASSPCNRSDMSDDNKVKHPRLWTPDKNNASSPADWSLHKDFGGSFDSFLSDAVADTLSEPSSPCNLPVMSDDNKKRHPRSWASDKNNESNPADWTIDNHFRRSIDSFASDAAVYASSEASSPCNRSDMSDENDKKHPQLWTPDRNH